MRTDVLVIGTNPTGLTLATELARRGVDHVLMASEEVRQATTEMARWARKLTVRDGRSVLMRTSLAQARTPDHPVEQPDTQVEAQYTVHTQHHNDGEQTYGMYADTLALTDIRVNEEIDRDELTVIFHPAGPALLSPLPDGWFRLVTPEPDPVHVLSYAESLGLTVSDLQPKSMLHIRPRVAKRFRTGNVFRAGDAAHDFGPFAPNTATGIEDAKDLAWRLTSAIQDGDQTVLDGYDATRRPAATRIMASVERMTLVASLNMRAARIARNALLKAFPASLSRVFKGARH